MPVSRLIKFYLPILLQFSLLVTAGARCDLRASTGCRAGPVGDIRVANSTELAGLPVFCLGQVFLHSPQAKLNIVAQGYGT